MRWREHTGGFGHWYTLTQNTDHTGRSRWAGWRKSRRRARERISRAVVVVEMRHTAGFHGESVCVVSPSGASGGTVAVHSACRPKQEWKPGMIATATLRVVALVGSYVCHVEQVVVSSHMSDTSSNRCREETGRGCSRERKCAWVVRDRRSYHSYSARSRALWLSHSAVSHAARRRRHDGGEEARKRPVSCIEKAVRDVT